MEAMKNGMVKNLIENAKKNDGSINMDDLMK
jgi:hypothetical protein